MLQAKYDPDPDIIEVGVDEAGAGCLAGPVTAAAVIWSDELNQDLKELELIDDSKKLSRRKREMLSDFIKEVAIDYHIEHVDHKTIDQINILQSRLKAMHKAIDHIEIEPDLILVDGDKFNSYVYPPTGKTIKHVLVTSGDALYQSIAAASILAKVERDRLMSQLDIEYPQYDWKNNKGYGSLKHREAIKKEGLSPYHRTTFGTCRRLIEDKIFDQTFNNEN